MRLSITSDEISADIQTALELLQDMQCREFELRGLGLEQIPNLDDRWLDQAEKIVRNKRFRVTSLNTPFFLEGPPDDEEVDGVFALAKRFNCNLISIHAPEREEDVDPDDEEDDVLLPPDEALDALRAFIARAKTQNCEVMIRTHPDSYASVVDEAVALIEALNPPAENAAKEIGAPDAKPARRLLGLDWDVAGCFGAGDDSGLDSVEAVLPVLKAVRVRDAVRRGFEIDHVSMGKGVIPWEDIFEQLWEGGYRGPIILEPDVTPKMKESRTALTLVARWIDACRTSPRNRDRD